MLNNYLSIIEIVYTDIVLLNILVVRCKLYANLHVLLPVSKSACTLPFQFIAYIFLIFEFFFYSERMN